MISKDHRPDLLARDAWKNLPVPAKPMRGFVCIVREDPQQFTRIIISNGERSRRTIMAEARVLAVGGAILHSSGGWIEPQIKAGDRVLTQGSNGFCTHYITPRDSVEYELVQFEQIAAILDEPPELSVAEDPVELEELPLEESPKLSPLLDTEGNPVTAKTP